MDDVVPTQMLKGYLDSYTTAGYFEGWAIDTDRPTDVIAVSVVHEGQELAWGLAHRFRRDLMEAQCGTGWCAFRARAEPPLETLPEGFFRLFARHDRSLLHTAESLRVMPDTEEPIDTVDAVSAVDPTILGGVWQLRGCEHVMAAFIRKHGVDAYVRAAYVYVLGRPADEGGRARYARCIRQATLTPVGVLEVLADSDEFRGRTRQLIAPNCPGFPFL